MKYCCIVLICVGVYIISGLFDYPAVDNPWFYGIAALWSTLIISSVAVCEISLPSSSIHSSCLSIYIILLESSAIFIDFLAILGGLKAPSFFYLHWDYMMNGVFVLELIGLLLWMPFCGLFNGLFSYNTRWFGANIYRYTNLQRFFNHQENN